MFGGFGGGFGGDAGLGGFFGGGGGGRFDREYQAFPVSFISKDELEKGNKIVLPPSALEQLARMNVSYPMLFEASCSALNTRTHVGVQEFIAEEGTCYLPYWLMGNLLLKEGDLVKITNTSLPKGSYVKLQPLKSDFLDIHNPRVVLESSLRNFSCVTAGDNIVIEYNHKKYEIEITECKPAKAVSIVEADINVDFDPPKDYKEPPRGGAAAAAQPVEEAVAQLAPEPEPEGLQVFSGQGQRIDGKALKPDNSSSPASKRPRLATDDDDAMPWKKRIKHGVKMVEAPYGFGMGHMSGSRIGEGSKVGVGEDTLFAGKGKALE